MKRNYTLDINNQNKTAFYSVNAVELLSKQPLIFKIINSLMDMYIYSKVYYISLFETVEEVDTTIYKFLVKADKKEFVIVVNANIISIGYANNYTEYKLDWSNGNYFVDIIKCQTMLGNKIIKQDFTHPDNVNIEIIIDDKIFRLEIPYRTEYLLNNEFFNMLNENSSINDLRRLYLKNFYPNQTTYEHSLDTNLSIYFKLNELLVLLDKLGLKDKEISYYLLSTIKDGVIIQASGNDIKNPEINIKDYNPKSNINLNREIEALYYRARKINN